MKLVYTRPLEASVTYSICTQLGNLGWVVDESDPNNNVTQQRAKTEIQRAELKKANCGNMRYPDFVLYENNSTIPIGIIEAKRPGESLEKALNQAENRYAKPLNAPLIFAYNDTFVATRYLHNHHPLKMDGEDIRQLIDHFTSLRFVNEGPEILSAPQDVQLSREELIRIFKRQANLLREAGLQAGLERFGAFSDILFLKLMDELYRIRRHSGKPIPLPKHLLWSEFQDKSPNDRFVYVKDVVWNEMNRMFGEIFSHTFPIQSAEIFDDIVKDLSKLNFTVADADIKGDAFEYFLKNAYQGIKIKDLGEYFTPRNIVRTMVSMVAPKIGEKIYDPFCGTGGFLIEAFKYISLRTKLTPILSNVLKEQTIYGSELTVTARVARMNMILYGDGHSNVVQQDSFKNPRIEEFDVILTNPPFSQSTRYGNYYPLSSQNGDAIAIQHCLKALKHDGRAAIVVKEDFLTKGGDIGKVRDMMLMSVKNVSVVSLPRRLFEPYTPTKTSIVYFEKAGTRKKVFFFMVKNVGHTFGARKKSKSTNDLPTVLSVFDSPQSIAEIEIEYSIKERWEVEQCERSLWIYDYLEVLPPQTIGTAELEPLGKFIVPSGEKFQPSDEEDSEFSVLGVNNRIGVFFNEKKFGKEINQKYIRVKEGDLVYNPHRVNVGSIGVVPKELDGGIVSGIYVVFKPKKTCRIPSYYFYYLLKSKPYLDIISSYDSKYGAVRANLKFEQLERIMFVVPTQTKIDSFLAKQLEISNLRKKADNLETSIVSSLVADNV